MNMPAGLDGQFADGLAQVGQQMDFARRGNRVHGIEAQSVEAIVAQPM